MNSGIYTRLYKFYDAKYGFLNIQNKRLKISTLSDLNDPFEFLGYRFTDKKARLDWRRRTEKALSKIGLICFCRDWRNPVIWSHYAHKHEGLALGFDVQTYGLIPVRYESSRKKFPGYSGILNPDPEKFFQEIIGYKFSHWRYENEVRRMAGLKDDSRQDGIYFREFDASLQLKEIIIGCKSEISKKQLESAIDLDGISVKTARLAFNSFDVVQQKLKHLQK